MTVETLIEEMQAVKAANQGLSLSEILRMFNIQALRDLTNVIRSIKNG